MNAFFDEAALEKRHRANMSSRLLSLLWTNSSFGLYQRLLSVSTLESEIQIDPLWSWPWSFCSSTLDWYQCVFSIITKGV